MSRVGGVAGKEEWVTNGIYYSLPIETLKFTCFSIKSTQSSHSFSKIFWSVTISGKTYKKC